MTVAFICHEHSDRTKGNDPCSCFITPFTLVHFATGVYFFLVYALLTIFKKKKNFCRNNGLVIWSAIIVFVLSLIYEIFDYYAMLDNGSWMSNLAVSSYNVTYPLSGISITPSSVDNSLLNSVGDQIFCTFGIMLSVYIGYRFFNKTNKFLLGFTGLVVYILINKLVRFFLTFYQEK
jgi:hypothetical protein